MRKVTDFIIEKRYIILGIFIILTIIAGIMTTKVNINYEMSEYLPSTSETRIGLDVMEEEFSEIEESSLNVMFKGLDDTQKAETLEYLKNIEGVASVDYEETENYNRDDYTLYVVNVDEVEDSETATNIYENIEEHFEDYEMYTSGSIAERNEEVLPMWIIVLAVGCSLIILMVMCESYVEPILFLISILMAVVLNMGTNAIFDSVSNITNSIVAILQMALSMDYSIMLMDRYRQEKAKEVDDVEAMENALYNACRAISSSSVTTIVGLLALVFMSFTIGRDLGFVLAKGVLCSLLCIFFVLPTLILMFDKLITRTTKKTPTIKLNKLGKIAYKGRYVAVILLLVAFCGSYFLKGNLDILYTDSQDDEISNIFEENNQMVLIYKTEDEETIAKYIEELEEKAGVDEVIGYGNTLNQEIIYSELNQKISDLGADIEVEDYLLKILYYNYYNPEENNTMTYSEFTNFIENEVYNNQVLSEELDENTKSDISRLSNFTQSNLITKERLATELASVLEMNESDIKDIFIYYNSKNNNLKLSMNDFIEFINKDVLSNEKYASSIDSSSMESLNTLSKFTDKTTINTKMTSKEMADLFGMDANVVDSLYTYYISINEISTKMTINEFSNFVLNDVLQNSEYSGLFDEETIQNIKMLATFSDTNTISQNMNSSQLANLFGIDEETAKQIMFLKYGAIDNETEMTQDDTSTWQMTPVDFVSLILSNSDNELVSNSLGADTLSNLQLLSNIMNSSVNKISYSYSEIANFIGIDNSLTKNIYTLYVAENTTTKLTPQEFVDFILNHKNDSSLASSLSTSTIEQLTLLKTVMNDVINNKTYTSSEISNLLGIESEDVKLLYGLYVSNYININQTMSLQNFVNFLIEDVMQNANYSSNFNEDTTSKLNAISEIMISSLNNTKCAKDQIYSELSKLSNNLDTKMIDLVYMYYGSINEYDENWTLTVEKFVNFINDEILTDTRFDDFIEDDMRQSIVDGKETIDEAKELLIGNGYSRLIINTKLDLESDETFEFIQGIKDDLGDKVSEFYIIGDSPMAYEMSQTFGAELNFITILTMLFIFIVVAITFKSALIPIILVLLIQTAVYMTMGILSFSGEGVYFIALLIVQSILMGATIDYAILYTSYYIEHRKTMDKKESVINSYNKSINTILTSASILIIVTFIIGLFTSGITSQICMTLSQGTLCSTLLILLLLPAVLVAFDKIIIKGVRR